MYHTPQNGDSAVYHTPDNDNSAVYHTLHNDDSAVDLTLRKGDSAVYDTPLTEYLNGWASVVVRGVLANHLLVAARLGGF